MASSDRRSSEVLARFRAVVAAESLIERAGLDIPLRSEPQTGRAADGSAWSFVVELHAEPDGGRVYSPMGLVRIEATVEPAGGRGPPIRLQALRATEHARIR